MPRPSGESELLALEKYTGKITQASSKKNHPHKAIRKSTSKVDPNNTIELNKVIHHGGHTAGKRVSVPIKRNTQYVYLPKHD